MDIVIELIHEIKCSLSHCIGSLPKNLLILETMIFIKSTKTDATYTDIDETTVCILILSKIIIMSIVTCCLIRIFWSDVF